MEPKTQEKPPRRIQRRRLIFLLVAVLLLAGCDVGAGGAEEKLAIGLIKLPIPKLRIPPVLHFDTLEIPGDSLIHLSTARDYVSNLGHFKQVSRAPDEDTVTAPYKGVKANFKESQANNEDLKQLRDEAIKKVLEVVKEEAEEELEEEREQEELEKRDDAIARAIVDAVSQDFHNLDREGRCALATQRMIQEGYAYDRSQAKDPDWGLYRLLAPSDGQINQWVDTQGSSTGGVVRESVKESLRTFRDQLWYPAGYSPKAQPPLNPVGYAQVAYALCP